MVVFLKQRGYQIKIHEFISALLKKRGYIQVFNINTVTTGEIAIENGTQRPTYNVGKE